MIALSSEKNNRSAHKPKVLFVVPAASYANARIAHFLRLFRLNHWNVEVACHCDETIADADRRHDIAFAHSPYAARNVESYRKLKSLIDSTHYDLIECHEYVCGALGRLAARDARKRGTKVIYALFSGFPFQKNTPASARKTHYALEKRLAPHCDCIVATKQEDYIIARDSHFSSTPCYRMHGDGIDTERFSPVSADEKAAIRNKLGIGSHERVLLCTNDWADHHNHKMLIYGLATAEERDHRLRLYYLGDGPRMRKLQSFVKAKNLEPWVRFTGHVENVAEWLQASDIVLSASEHVGHATGPLEAMACGIPLVASKVRGHTDIVVNRCSGMLFPLEDVNALARSIFIALAHQERIGAGAREMALLHSHENVLREMAGIYHTVTGRVFENGITPKTTTEPDFLSVQYAVR